MSATTGDCGRGSRRVISPLVGRILCTLHDVSENCGIRAWGNLLYCQVCNNSLKPPLMTPLSLTELLR